MADIERIERELREGLEGVTRGPWHSQKDSIWTGDGRKAVIYVYTDARCPRGNDFYACHGPDAKAVLRIAQEDLDHLSRCDPDTICALLDELVRRAEIIERAKEVVRPFAEYMAGGADLDHEGRPLSDEQGVGWVYLNHGHFRVARAFLSSLELSHPGSSTRWNRED